MHSIVARCTLLIAALCLLSGSACAEPPDPVQFDWAIERGDLKKVQAWLDEGLDPEFQGVQFGTGLMAAAWYGNIPLMALFIERGANPRRSNRHGEQPLQLAAWNGHIEAVKWLLEHGALLNREDNHWGALHYAVFNGHKDIVQYLIGRGADVNARSPNGSTPLMMAAREGRESVVKNLFEAGADPKLQNDWGDTALTMAMRYDHYHLGKMISTPEDFAIAVRSPKEKFGEPSRSVKAPSAIEDILTRIRAAEAEGRPTDALRQQLAEAVNTFRHSADRVIAPRRSMPQINQPRTIVVTARRSKAGAERAQILINGQPVASPASARPGKPVAKAPSPAVSGASQAVRPSAGQVADLLRQIRLAEAQGQTTDELRQQLTQAVETMKP